MSKMMRAARLRPEAVCVEGNFAIQTVRRFMKPDMPGIYNTPLATIVRMAEVLGCAPVELLPILGRRPRKHGMLHRAGVIPTGRKNSLDPAPMRLEEDDEDG